MQSIKLEYTTDSSANSLIAELMKEYSPIVRSAYCRFMENMSEKDIRSYIRSTFGGKDSWFVQSAIYDANGMAQVDTNQERTRIFGGKQNWLKLIAGKIDKLAWKSARLLPITSVGEAPNKGNRKFRFDLDDNRVVFKVNRNTHLVLTLPKLRKNYAKILFKLQGLCEGKNCPVTIKLDTKYIYISFDEKHLDQAVYAPIVTRHAGVDLNPNYIGFVVYDGEELVFKKMYNLTLLTQKSGQSSTSSASKYLENKLGYEVAEIAKDIQKHLVHYQVNCLSVEALKIKPGNLGKGKVLNRLCNNKWKRARLVQMLEKRCNLVGIKYLSVNPAYSSYIGNICHPDLPDPMAAASEISRRGYNLAVLKNKEFYPAWLPDVEVLRNRWKEAAGWSQVTTWNELFVLIKNSGVKYRVPIPGDGFLAFRCNRSSVTYA